MIPKYRAWDKNTADMVDIKTIDLEKDGSIGCLVDYSGINLDVSECIIMQSTGLKDKNDVEIFEGDVVLFSVSDGFNHLDHEKAIVQASECHSGLVCKLVDLDLEYRIYYDPVFHTDYEVIGNVYENSELLEEPR
ncbi:YopX family protein [Enterococcus durans]|uniref:YopX family protein n=1 Tax=Enterococcus durans TaxID=53345 RepID=UPI0028923B5F|nr:YopX family protein [Enterococcus durans]MDT2836241.1 YopX family protein [Enterococcus durans]